MNTLYSKSFGNKGFPELLILHGLLGSSRNWLAAARDLATFAKVHVLDLRNHGASFHSNEHSYRLMAEDVLRWMDERKIGQVHLLGHSMGGKLAMFLACNAPERLKDLIVMENAPRKHTAYYEKEIQALLRLNLDLHSSRTELEKVLEKDVPEWALRKFLISGLYRGEESNQWQWQANLPVLYRELEELSGNPLKENDRYAGASLFIMGGDSPFIPKEEWQTIYAHFPNAEIIEIPGSRHNPHFEKREDFVNVVRAFIGKKQSSQPL